ncbi:hypothetical protein LCM10_17350 [Rossellomorea aquimaris]|uniref:hypothetical protein n=1 Tax=Rossellomorea aquimaris TaxID=189382 RepID=UPI001CD693EC|nr:hypothetical protein [Rossellomorea aquimaris]MCA1056753.1 hypothetical protein [Rossellomorea aquimaris]
MNHAIVLCAQHYLGFELCRALLEKGWTVTAVDDGLETSDKWMEIGRNANIQYFPSKSWNRELPVDCRVFLPYYDQFDGEELECLSLIESLNGKAEELPEMVRILRNHSHGTDQGVYRTFSGTTFHLPTLYGPHQPDHFLFAQLMKGVERDKLRYEDDPSGAIYVKDAAECIIKHSSRKGTYLLKSLSDNSWKEALSYITEESILPKTKNVRHEGEAITVHPSASHATILEKQKLAIGSF